MGASAGSGEFSPFSKHEATIGTGGRFQNKLSSAIPRDGFDDMNQMFLDLSLRDAEQLCQLPRRPQRAGQELHDSLPQRSVRG
jgi:hypothetical protein